MNDSARKRIVNTFVEMAKGLKPVSRDLRSGRSMQRRRLLPWSSPDTAWRSLVLPGAHDLPHWVQQSFALTGFFLGHNLAP